MECSCLNPIFEIISPFSQTSIEYNWDETFINNFDAIKGLHFLICNISQRVPYIRSSMNNHKYLTVFNDETFRMSEFNEFVNIYNNAVNIYRKYIGKRYVNQHVKSIRLTSNEYKFLNDYLYGKFFENFNELKNKDRKYDNPYGEVTYEGFNVLLRELNLREKDVFVDMGSGVGQLLFQASALTEVEKVIGIESLSYPINKSREMKKEFIKLMRFGRFLHCPITLLEGDFFDNQFKKYINEGTHLLIHSSNRSPQFYYDMEEKIIRNLSDGTKFLSSTTFRVSRTINKRNVNNVGSILKVLKEITERNLVSYKDAEATFTLYLVDRRDVKMYLREKEFDKRRRRSPRFLNFI